MIKIFNLLDYLVSKDYSAVERQKRLAEYFNFEDNSNIMAVHYDETRSMYIIHRFEGKSYRTKRAGKRLDLFRDEHQELSEGEWAAKEEELDSAMRGITELTESLNTNLPNVIGYSNSQFYVYYADNSVLYIPLNNSHRAKIATDDIVKKLDTVLWYNVEVKLDAVPESLKDIVNETKSIDFLELSNLDVGDGTEVEDTSDQSMFPVHVAEFKQDKIILEFEADTTPQEMIEHIKLTYGLLSEEETQVKESLDLKFIIENAREFGFSEQATASAIYREEFDAVLVQDTDYTYPIVPELSERLLDVVDIDTIGVSEQVVYIYNHRIVDSSDMMVLSYIAEYSVVAGENEHHTLFVLPTADWIYLASNDWHLADGTIFGVKKMERR